VQPAKARQVNIQRTNFFIDSDFLGLGKFWKTEEILDLFKIDCFVCYLHALLPPAGVGQVAGIKKILLLGYFTGFIYSEPVQNAQEQGRAGEHLQVKLNGGGRGRLV
jgi:hypothetical protein